MGKIRSAVRFGRFAKFAAILILAPAVADASFVKTIGGRSRGSGITANSSTTVSVPTSGVAAGNSIVVTLQVASLGGAVTCSDPVNGAYSTDVVSPSGVTGIAIASKHNVTALSFLTLITCTYPAFNGASSMSAYEFSGLETLNTLDRTAQGSSATGFLVSSGLTATTSQAGELVFGFVWLPDATQTFFSATSGGNPLESFYNPPWTEPTAVIPQQKPMFRFVNSVRQYEANGTIGGSVGGWIAQIATYRLAPDLCTGINCSDNNGCTADSCDPATGICSHVPEPEGLHCGDPTSGICDSADRCDASGVCQSNHEADGTPCSSVDSDCDLADTCLAGVCHDNGVVPAGTSCGDPTSTACNAADSCNGTGLCVSNLAADGSACGDAGSECVNADGCLAGVCHDNGFKAAGSVCGDSSSSQCDNADSCNGAGSCLVNHAADGTLCGDAGTECVNQDVCAGGACQDNGFKAAGAMCGDPSTRVCDSSDSCDGSGSCSTNHVASGTPCDDGQVCTSADACDGAGLCSGARDEQCVACVGNTAPIVSPTVVANPGTPMALGAGLLTVTASFTDSAGQTRTCMIDWGDGSAPDSVTVTEPTETDPGSCTGTHLYTAVGVNTVSITVADPCGESAGAIYQYAVVYDPDGGFVTGAGWIDSPPGAFRPDPGLTGKAFFGFVSGYFKGNATVPSGRTDFHFHAANFDFSSSTYEWLVISGAKARFRGTGQVNGAGSFGFALTAWDGEAPGGGGVDRFRIRIWDRNQGDALVYDNQIACPNQGDNADPCTGIGGGAIVIHKK